MAKIIPLLFMRRESLRKARGWWSPTHGGTHIKRMPVRDHGGAPGHRYRDGAILPASDIAGYYRNQVQGKAKGVAVPNPVFVLGELTHSKSALVAKYLQMTSAPREVRLTGRTLKHADERRPDAVLEIVGDLPAHFVEQAQVLPNPQNAGRVLLVSAFKRTQKGKHYVAAVEVERHHDALYLTTFMTMPERTLRQALALMANWQEGQRPPSG